MSEKCIICKEGDTPSKHLIKNRFMIDELLSCCQERVTLGQSHLEELTKLLSSTTDTERDLLHYHSECRKPLVNKSNIKRLRDKQSDESGNTQRGPGRPSTSALSGRPKRLKVAPKSEVCMFASCNFCTSNPDEPLHRVLSDNMGENFLNIKRHTHDDNVRICVSHLQDTGDASALELYYHRRCLIYAQRTCSSAHEGQCLSQLIRIACEEELITSVQNTLADPEVQINMSDVNDEYLSILRRYQVPVIEKENHRKHLKHLISDRMPDVQFVKSSRKNESENLVLPRVVSEAIELRSALLNDGEMVGYMKIIANKLRDEIMQHRDWSFKGNFDDFENPPLLQFFLRQVLYGPHILKVTGMRNDEVDKTIDVACQFIIQNTKTDRQVKHNSKKAGGFLQTVQTPLCVGLPLTVHLRTRDQCLINNLTEVYIGCHYQKILNIEKRVQQGVLRRMGKTGGFCLPDFVKKGVNVWFAIDNIDLLEDTPTGQNTFHGTVVVLNQRANDGEPINEPFVLPKDLSPLPLSMKVTFREEPVIKPRPIRFQDYQVEKRRNLLSNDFTHTWALGNHLGIETSTPSDTTIQYVSEPGMVPDKDVTPDAESQMSQIAEESIVMADVNSQTRGKIRKEKAMPTWAASKSLLLSESPKEHCRTNTEVIAPLLKTSPTDYATLYTALMLAQGMSAVIVGPERKTLITLDLDLYNRALQIQQSVLNTNWILRAGALHIVFAALHALGKTIDASGIDTCTIESGAYTSAALRGIFGGKVYKRGTEYHITNCLAIMMMRFDAIQAKLPPGPLQTQCNALRTALHKRSEEIGAIFDEVQTSYTETIKPLENEDHPGELAQFLVNYLEQVESLLQLISACRAGNWEQYLAALENLIKYFFHMTISTMLD